MKKGDRIQIIHDIILEKNDTQKIFKTLKKGTEGIFLCGGDEDIGAGKVMIQVDTPELKKIPIIIEKSEIRLVVRI